LINYFKSYSSLGDDHFFVSPLYLLLSAQSRAVLRLLWEIRRSFFRTSVFKYWDE